MREREGGQGRERERGRKGGREGGREGGGKRETWKDVREGEWEKGSQDILIRSITGDFGKSVRSSLCLCTFINDPMD